MAAIPDGKFLSGMAFFHGIFRQQMLALSGALISLAHSTQSYQQKARPADGDVCRIGKFFDIVFGEFARVIHKVIHSCG